jgi:hypothetical protein
MLNAWAADGIFPGGPAEPSVETDGVFVSSDFGDGDIAELSGSFPPYGPNDASSAPNPSTLDEDLSDTFPFPVTFAEGAKALLAVELASASGLEPLPSTQKRAQTAYMAMLAYYVVSPRAGQDLGLAWAPSLRRYGFR